MLGHGGGGYGTTRLYDPRVSTPSGRTGRISPSGWWRGLGILTRTGSPGEGLAWALYDFANTIYSFMVVSFAMGIWATRFLGEGPGLLWFGVAASVSVGLNALVSPVLGAMSDRVGRRKPFLGAFTALCVAATALIGLVDVRLGLVAFAIANFAYQGALIYYDALLDDVAHPSGRGRLSGVGVAFGYTGTLTVGGLWAAGVTRVDGQSSPATFVLVAILFGVFALPLFLRVRERRSRAGTPFRISEALASWDQLATTVRHAAAEPGLLRFIVARFFYTDPVNTTIAVMGTFAVRAVGFTEAGALVALLMLTVVAVIASFGWGALSDRIGPRRTLLAVLGSWAVGLAIIALFLNQVAFFVAGAILGSGLGGVAVADRYLLLRLAPPDRLGEMFGLYGLVGKASAVIGPLLFGLIVNAFLSELGRGAYQVAILSLLGLMLIGLVIVRRVPEGRGVEAGQTIAPLEPAIVPPGELSR
jgi:UMF1 family MFS transporter